MRRLLQICLLFFPVVANSQTENFWVKKNDFGGLKRERSVAFSIGNYGYVSAGVDTAENVLNDLWQYDPLADTWSQKANLPGSVRRDAIAFAIGDKGYVGTGINNDEALAGIILKDFWEYNPSTNMWTQKADYPGNAGMGVYMATGFSVDSKGYLCCGKIGPSYYSSELWEYKPSIDQWTQRSSFPGGVRYQLSSFSIGYYGYVGLGADQNTFRKDFWKYNAGNNQWSPIANLPGSERGGACTFNLGNRGFVCMGNNGGILGDLWEYNPISNQWSVRASYGGSERKNAIAFTAYGKAYVGTGKGYSGKKAGMEEYTPYANVGLNETNLISISVYPNPTMSVLNLSSESILSEVSLYSADGRRVIFEKPNTDHFSIDMNQQPTGIYILTVSNDQGKVISTEKIIRQ
jgi:N-acetylneuraminic acid mutarotase